MSTRAVRSMVIQKPAVCRGMALLMTLAMLVLISFAIFAFFVRATSDRKVQGLTTKQAETTVLGRGIQNAIIWELRNEMLAGSDATGSDTNSPAKYFLLRPRTSADMIPRRVLTAAVASSGGSRAAEKFDNLVKQSISQAYAFPGSSVPAPMLKAVPANSATRSLDGRAVSMRSWNLPRLIGDSTSASGFDNSDQLPEWIVVARGGIMGSPSLAQAKDRSPTNNQYVIGRFAYNIYDQGGLIDANVVGFPSAVGTGKNLQLLKGTLAGSDLTQIPGVPSVQVVDQLVAWRNTASLDGHSPTTPNGLPSYVNAVLQFGAVRGFLAPWSDATHGEDRQFLNRQDLIRFAESGQAGFDLDAGGVPLALPYLSTFSRALDQPSFAPSPARPPILSNTATHNFAGNDAAGHESEFNPDLLSMRVIDPFTRNDGEPAVPGEPLLKKRFALNRLAWITYRGPSAARNVSDPDLQTLLNSGITEEFLQQGTDENIKKYFGLKWDSANGRWIYDHGITGSLGQPIIGYLSRIRDAGREPDFFEILKASVNAGAIAKGATRPAALGGMLEEAAAYAHDTKTDYAIFGIGANIIDQFDADGYPVRIRFDDGSKWSEFRGNENLPYFYRIRAGLVVSGLPSPLPTTNNATEDPWTDPSSLSDCGFQAVLWQPDIWNPYDRDSPVGNPRPTELRIVADSAPLDADGASLSTFNSHELIVNCLTTSRHYSYNFDPSKTPTSYTTSSTPPPGIVWQGDNTALTFSDLNGSLFREPTILAKPGVPAGSNLTLGPDNFLRTLFQDPGLTQYWDSSGPGVIALNDYYNTNSPVPYIGFYYGQGPIRWVETIGATSTVFTSEYADTQTSSTAGSPAVTYRVQYRDPAGQWITYDEKYVTNITHTLMGVVPSTGNLNILNGRAVGSQEWVGGTDPRTRRFGNPGSGNRGGLSASVLKWLDRTNNVTASDRPDTSSGFGWWSSAKTITGLPRDTVGMAEVIGGWFPDPAVTWVPFSSPPRMHYRPGHLSQNNPDAEGNNFPSQVVDSAPGPQYYADPDGVVRRAMGAYVPVAATGPATTTIGLPMASTGSGSPSTQNQSRPAILNRPFRSVAELGHVFSGTPWKNLDISTPESGFSALLDVFSIQATDRADAMIAGAINLNTRRRPVLQAVFAGEAKDVQDPANLITAGEAELLATSLVQRSADSSSGQGPLTSLADLVGKWTGQQNASLGGIDGSTSYSGFSADLGTAFAGNATMNNIQRFREAPIRALAGVGTVRVWNLLIDVVVQTGHYPSSASTFDNFLVRGEQRFWLHVALDRFSGDIIARQLEIVKE